MAQSTVEKLVFEIFDRKKRIIEQAKHQSQLFNQHLASKLAIDGIAPPSWLFSPNRTTSPKEISTDELIAKLVKPSVCCSRPHFPLYSQQVGVVDNNDDEVLIEKFTSDKCVDTRNCPVISCDNVQINADEVLNEAISSDKCLDALNSPVISCGNVQIVVDVGDSVELCRENCAPVLGISGEDKAGCLEKNVSEVDFRLKVPVDETEKEVLNIREVPQSLVKIQRSKSRQKALELRSASKSVSKIGLSSGNLDDNFKFSGLVNEEEGWRDEVLQSTERRGAEEGCEKQGFGESICRNKENDMDISIAKAADFVGGSQGSRSEPSNCGKDVSSSGAKVGTRQSVLGFNSNQSDYVHNLQQTSASSQACVIGSLDGEDRQGSDIENNVSTGNILGSEFSRREAGGYSNTSCSSDNAKINHDTIREFKYHLPVNRAHGSLVTGCGANVLDEQGDVRQSIAADRQNEKELTVDPCSSQHTAGLDKAAQEDTPSDLDGANHGPPPSTSDKTALVTNTLHKEPELVESYGAVHRVTMSNTFARQQISISSCLITRPLGSMSKSDLKQKSAASVELLTALCGQMLPTFHETNDIINEQQCADNAVDREFVGSSPIDTNQRGELESLVEGSSLNSSLFAEPKVLYVNNLTFTSSTSGSEMKRLNNMSERKDCSFLDPAPSVDKGAPGDIDQLSVDVESVEGLGVCSKEGEAWADTFDTNAIYHDYAMAGLNCERAEVNDTPHIHNHRVKLCVDQGDDSLPAQQSEEGNWRPKSMDKVSLVSNALVSNACRKSNSLDLTNAESHGGLTEEGETSGLKTPNSDGSPVFASWPQLKRRKIKHHESNRHTSSPCVGMKKLHNIQISPSSTYMTNTEKDGESIDMGIKELVDFDFTEPDYTFKSQYGEEHFCSKEQNKPKSSLTPSELPETTLSAGLTKKKAGNSRGLYVEGMETHSRIHDDEQCSRHSSFFNENIAEITYLEKIGRMDQRTVSSEHNEGPELRRSVLSPRSNSECNVVGLSLPIFDEFMVDAQSYNGELNFSADEIDFEKLKSPRNMLERASILAKICQSASTDTPLSDLSSALERASLLASLDMDNLPLNVDDMDKQHAFGNSHVNNVKDSLERIPQSDCLPNYGTRYGWNPRNLSPSPVGKFWESLSLQSGSSSDKCTSTNPDLKCFRIEEDSCGSEENDTMDDSMQNDTDSSPANPSNSRQPLKEITNLVAPSVSTEPSSVSLTTKVVVGATEFKAKRSLRKQTSSEGNTEIREKQKFSVGANGIKKDRESNIVSVNRPVLRSNSRLKGEEQKLPLRNSRKNNIVSNVTSFLPLVQQKQAAPICAGKREVKVKALEAAEAAKRLEERRQNERRIKKEALRSERAKLEEKNMREMELKKKKEAERKKKEDDVISKKRLREEEDMKEEKKRMRVEASQRQREQEEKLRMRAKKAEKQKDHPKGGRKNNKPQVAESKNPQTNGSVRGHKSVLKDTETRRASVELAMHTVDESPTRGILMVQTNQEKSYEISPYQCSDDEDDEEEELPIKKSIPSWASKSSIALLLALQQEVKPDEVFRPDSFCSIDDVLLHCKVN